MLPLLTSLLCLCWAGCWRPLFVRETVLSTLSHTHTCTLHQPYCLKFPFMLINCNNWACARKISFLLKWTLSILLGRHVASVMYSVIDNRNVSMKLSIYKDDFATRNVQSERPVQYFCSNSWVPHTLTGEIRGVARICCEEGQSWKLGHGGLQGRVQQRLDD